MSISEFKKIFNAKALSHGWVNVPGGWLQPPRDRDQCIVAIEVQKSSYGKQFYIGIKVFVDGAFGFTFGSGFSMQTQNATLYRRQPKELDAVFDLSNTLDADARSEGLNRFFEFLGEFAECARTRQGVIEQGDAGMLFVTPSVRAEVQRLNSIQEDGRKTFAFLRSTS